MEIPNQVQIIYSENGHSSRLLPLKYHLFLSLLNNLFLNLFNIRLKLSDSWKQSRGGNIMPLYDRHILRNGSFCETHNHPYLWPNQRRIPFIVLVTTFHSFHLFLILSWRLWHTSIYNLIFYFHVLNFDCHSPFDVIFLLINSLITQMHKFFNIFYKRYQTWKLADSIKTQ